MIGNFSWVISGKLAGSALPTEAYEASSAAAQDLAEGGRDLAALHTQGIRCLVSLTKTAAGLGPYCQQANLDWLFFPIPDFGIPQSGDQFHKLISRIIDSMDKGRPVCVHCFAGIGRTGLVLCCTVGRYLQLSPAKAIATVQALRSALETIEQERFVHHYLEQLPQ
jgi:hypothetical protein